MDPTHQPHTYNLRKHGPPASRQRGEVPPSKESQTSAERPREISLTGGRSHSSPGPPRGRPQLAGKDGEASLRSSSTDSGLGEMVGTHRGGI